MSFVELDHDHSLPVLRLNRPPVNAVNRQLALDLHAALDELENGGGATPFVFAAVGSTFCAGLDLREVPRLTRDEQREFIQLCNRTAARLYRWPAPVVGAIAGHAMAAGFVLAITPDYRIAADSDIGFGVPEIKAGIPFPAVPLTIMNAELSSSVVRRLALTCATLSAAEARQQGVVDELAPPERFEQRALEVLCAMAAQPRGTYARIKAQVRAAAYARIEEILTTAADPLIDSWLSAETPAAAATVLHD